MSPGAKCHHCERHAGDLALVGKFRCWWIDFRIETEQLAGEDVSGEDVSGENVSGEDVSGEDISGEDVSGEDVSGEDVSGEDVSGSRRSEVEITTALVAGSSANPSPTPVSSVPW